MDCGNLIKTTCALHGTGRCVNCSRLKRIGKHLGNKNPNFGKKTSIKTKKKQSKKAILRCENPKYLKSLLKTSFKKGNIPWNKDISIRLNPKGEFKSGINHPEFGRKGKDHSSWKGGKHINSQGYVLLHKPNHIDANNNGYVLEHRYKMIKKINRPIKKGEIIHHIDRNKTNNKITNLLLLTNKQHLQIHMKSYNFLVEHNLISKYIKWYFKNEL